MDNAYQELGQGFKSVCYPLQRQDALMKKEDIYLHKISDTLCFFHRCGIYAFLLSTHRLSHEKLLISDGKKASDSPKLILTLRFRKEYL